MDDEVQAQFCGITAAEPAVADEYLQVCDGNLERAVALYFENGGSSLSASTGASNTTPTALPPTDEVRAPIAGTRGVLMDDMPVADSAFSGPVSSFGAVHSALFDEQRRRQRRRRGVFDQSPSARGSDNDDEDDYDSEFGEGGASAQETSKANRLAHMFRPPYELMAPHMDMERARERGMAESRWIMINLQDLSDFECQVLNRDLWKDTMVQETVRANFLFFQHTTDSILGQEYARLYSVDAYPHVAIIDPRTGERVRVWSGHAIPPDTFLEQVVEFLDEFSLDPRRKNPVSKRPRTEGRAESDVMVVSDEDEPSPQAAAKDKGKMAEQAAEAAPAVTPAWAQIQPVEHPEPGPGAGTTRLQIRMPPPLPRIVRRFQVTDLVRSVFEVIKAQVPEARQREFSLVFQRTQLLDKLDETLEQAGLANAAVQMEFCD